MRQVLRCLYHNGSHVNPYPKRYLHRFSRFCRARGRDRQTDKQTTLYSMLQ